MAQDDQLERLRRLRMARNTASTRLEANAGPYNPGEGYAYGPPIAAAPPRHGHGALAALLFLLLVAAVVLGGVAYTFHSFDSAVGGPKKTVRFVVKQGESVGAIASDLQRQGLVSSSMLFQLYYRINGGSDSIQAGMHTLDTTMSMNTIAAQLQQPVFVPPPNPTVIRGTSVSSGFPITFLPGKRAEEIAGLLQKYHIVSSKDFMYQVQHGKFNYWFLKGRPAGASLEGFLAPGTFTVTTHDDAHRVVGLMLAQFNRVFTPAMHMEAATAHRSVFEVVTMASIVQRESVRLKDLPYIASVYYNRLANVDQVNMKLDADPTVQYAMGYRKDEHTWWEKYPKKIDTSINSPYNTYQVQGLPPGPISNPGIHALMAAIKPAKSKFLYFQVFSRDGKTSHTYFCVTTECQQNRAGVRIN